MDFKNNMINIVMKDVTDRKMVDYSASATPGTTLISQKIGYYSIIHTCALNT